MNTGPHERLLREFFDSVWNTGEVAGADAFIGETYTIFSDPGDAWDGQTLDLAGFKARLVQSRQPFPDLSFEIEEAVEAGDRVALCWTMRGTQTGPMGPIPPTGRAIAVKGMTVYYFAEGRIVGHRQVVDRMGVVRQLGATGPAPG